MVARWRWGSAMVIIGLSQLPLEAEGYRHIVCLIDNYASSYGVLTKDLGLESDSGIALKQTCRAVHAWYHWTAEERGLVLHETSSEDEERYRTKLPASGGLGQSLADLRRRGLSAPRAMKGTRFGF